jgi:hypothetical protein
MTKAAAAGLPRVHPAEDVLRKARRAEVRKALPAGAVLHPIAVQAAVALHPGVAIPVNNGTHRGSSPAEAAGPVMEAAAIPGAAAPEAVPAQGAATQATAAVIPVAAAAPAAADQPNEASHHNKQIGLATALFVCFKTFE